MKLVLVMKLRSKNKSHIRQWNWKTGGQRCIISQENGYMLHVLTCLVSRYLSAVVMLAMWWGLRSLAPFSMGCEQNTHSILMSIVKDESVSNEVMIGETACFFILKCCSDKGIHLFLLTTLSSINPLLPHQFLKSNADCRIWLDGREKGCQSNWDERERKGEKAWDRGGTQKRVRVVENEKDIERFPPMCVSSSVTTLGTISTCTL